MFYHDSPLVGREYGVRMDRRIYTLCNGVIRIHCMNSNKMQVRVCVFFVVVVVFFPASKTKSYTDHSKIYFGSNTQNNRACIHTCMLHLWVEKHLSQLYRVIRVSNQRLINQNGHEGRW